MRLTSFSVLILGLWCSLVSAASDSHAKNVANPYTRPLRSAYLLRDVGKIVPPALTAIDEVELIQRHFDAVLAILEGQKQDSLATTLDRLEKRRLENWTNLERKTWSRYLEQRRDSQMTSLIEYRNRGVFPKNIVSDRPIPIFVDSVDTACAVGYLMRASGNRRLVDTIERDNKYVCIVDVTEGPLVDWILHSGLTQEEAALIQPGYGGTRSWPGCQERNELCFASNSTRDFVTLDSLAENGQLSFGGLRYENLHISATTSPPFPVPLPDLETPIGLSVDPKTVGVWAGFGGNGDFYDQPYFETWLGIGGLADAFSTSAMISPLQIPANIFLDQRYAELKLSFDVVTEQSEQMIVAAAIESNDPYDAKFKDFEYMVIETKVFSRTPGEESDRVLASMLIDENSGPVVSDFGRITRPLNGALAQFTHQDAIHVESTIRIDIQGSSQFEFASFHSMTHSFQVVPEPATSYLVLWLVVVIVCKRRRRLS